MKLYMYTNKNSLFNYLSRNFIASDEIVREINGNRTISTHCEHFLFITHKKLSRQAREVGIATPSEVHQITLEIELEEGEAKNCSDVVFVEKNAEALTFVKGKLNQYDQDRYLGIFVMGAIPLSCVTGYYFDNEDDLQNFERPSPDYWYPRDKFKLLPEDFSEALSINVAQDELVRQVEIDLVNVEMNVRKQEKEQAALLHLMNATQNWQYGKFRLNMDSTLQSILGISDQEIGSAISNYQEIKDTDNIEILQLIPDDIIADNADSINQKIYNNIYDCLIKEPYDKPHNIDFFTKLFHLIEQTCNANDNELPLVSKALEGFMQLILGHSKKTIEELLLEIPIEMDVLKALFLVSKNPDNYDHFMSSLDKYNLDLVSKRRACILWGALNGLRGMPGDGANKDNPILWQFIEWKVQQKMDNVIHSFPVRKPDLMFNDNNVLGISLKIEKVITHQEIHEYIITSPFSLKEENYKTAARVVENKLGKKKFKESGYNKVIASCDLPPINKGEPMNEDQKMKLDDLINCFKKPVLNKEKLYVEWIEPLDKFKIIHDANSDYWKTFLIKMRG